MKKPLNPQWTEENPCSIEQTVGAPVTYEPREDECTHEIGWLSPDSIPKTKPCPITGSEYPFPQEYVEELMETSTKDLVKMLLELKGVYATAKNFILDIGRINEYRKYARI
jgi:hypothetical protein